MTEYANNGQLAIQDNPDDPGDLPYQLYCCQSMMNLPLLGVEEIEQLRDLCDEALDEINE